MSEILSIGAWRVRVIKPSDSPRKFIDAEDSPQRPGDTILYRFYDADSRLLYVGISRSLRNRVSAHRWRAPWYSEATTLVTEWWPNRHDAQRAELAAIRTESPLYNIHCAVS